SRGNWASLQRLFVKLPSSHQLTEARLLYLQLQDQTSLLLDRMIDADFQGGNWELDLTEIMQTQEIDEGFTYLFQFRFDADCDVTSNAPIGVDSRVLFSPNLPETPNPLDTGVVNPVGLRSLVSRLRLDVPLANNTSLDDKGRWALELFNAPVRIASTESGALENCWMEVQSASGAVSNFRLIDQNTGQVISPVNGLFQLGQLNPRDTLQLLLIGDNRSCIREEILLRYGWNCTPYVNRIQPACFERTQQLTLISPPAELEQLVISPPGPFNLCDTVDYHIIELFNADLGRAYDILTEVRLPPGLSILPGSSQLAYPFDQPYEPIADPIDLGGGQWQWNLSTLNDSIGLNGLPGSNLEPANKARLRFQLITDCDFISNSELIAVVRANQNCDQAANTLAESSASIEVVGVDEPYTTDISVSPLLTVGCEDEEMLELTINPNGTTSAADSLFLSLPPGISYVSSSYQALENAPVDGPSIANQGSFDQLRWRIPTGITSSQSIRFRIGIEGLQSLDCGQQLMNIQTLAPANALCAADGQSCDILVETGSSLYAFQVDRPVLEAFDLSVQAEADGSEYLLFYELSVRNGGPQTTLPTYVDLYIDADGDGLLSAGDQLVALDSITANISTGASRLIGGAFRLADVDQICQFIAVIDPLKHCACRTAGASIRQPIEIRRPDLTALCSGEPAQLGIDSAEQTLYQWEPADFLDCALCPQTTFLYENLSGQPQQLEYLLRQEDSSGCLINNLFSVIVQPEPAILNSSDILCLGSEITLEATPAVTYNWQGPGIVNPRLSTQTVQPTEDALYIVNITDSVGCMGTDSLLVLVRPLPGVDAGPDTTVCENAVIQLDASEVDGYSYQWSPAGLLNNPTIPNPLLLQNETTVFRLTVTDQNGCIGFDSVRVAFSEPPNLQFSAIDPLCEGEEVVLEVSGAQTYDWSPEEGLSCTDCPSVVASPMETTVYTVVGTDAEGCSNSLAIRVEVLAASNSQTQQGACEGEVVEIFGQSIEQSGLYCDTLSSVLTGCDSISCIDLSFNPRPETSSEAILCEGDTLAFAGELYTQSGLYCGDFQTAAGCDSTHCVAVEVVEGPQIIFDESVEGFRGTDIPLMLPTGFDYQWRPATYLSCTDCSNPVASIPLDEPSDELVYDILFSDDNNCQARGRLRILLLDPVCQEPFIFVPNAFTPNEDGENDFFQVYGAAIESMHLMIYDRWGRKVFETRDPQAQWDGTFNGQKLYSESFGYYLEVDCVGGDRFLKKGNVTLIR
ncbi:MAG: gliding motility-associated C-terminal domain-containing protein, partial [Bacteroidota bacterium]